MNESEARSEVQSYEEKAVEAMRQMGHIEEISEEAEVAIEDCVNDRDGSRSGSGKIVSRTSWNVTRNGGPGPRAVEAALVRDSMVVVPYDEQIRKLSASVEGLQVVVAFWQDGDSNGRVDLTVSSPCIDGIA